MLGRWFDSDGEAVLSYSLWKDRFGADPSIVGRNVLVRDTWKRIAGVMPPDFRYPLGTQIWIPHPLGTPAYESEYSSRNLILVGRLRRRPRLGERLRQPDESVSGRARAALRRNVGPNRARRRSKTTLPTRRG